MLGVGIEVRTKIVLYQFIGATKFIFSTSWHVKMRLALNENRHTKFFIQTSLQAESKHAHRKLLLNMKILYAKQATNSQPNP